MDEVRADDLPPRYNVAPTMPVYAVALSRTERDSGRKKAPRRVLGTFKWGLVPVQRDHPPQRRQGNVCSLLRSV